MGHFNTKMESKLHVNIISVVIPIEQLHFKDMQQIPLSNRNGLNARHLAIGWNAKTTVSLWSGCIKQYTNVSLFFGSSLVSDWTSCACSVLISHYVGSQSGTERELLHNHNQNRRDRKFKSLCPWLRCEFWLNLELGWVRRLNTKTNQ